ncbi:MAG: hypothetical protein WCW44_04730, partial [archaeon]
IYASWSKGLLQDSNALKVLKNSNLVAGVELYNLSESFDLLKSFELKYNQHNALCDYGLWLESEYFVPTMQKFPEVVKRCKESAPSVIGFHAGFSAVFEKNILSSTIVSGVLRSLNFLDNLFDKKVIFETAPYHSSHFQEGNSTVLKYVSSPEFVKQILAKSRSGYLLDLSHNFVSGATKIDRGEYKGEIEDYFAELLSSCANETYQLHLNVPSFTKEKGFFDSHGVVKLNNALGKRTLLIAKEIVDSCPNLKVITLEMNTNLPPIKHAKVMVQQAKIVEKELLRK